MNIITEKILTSIKETLTTGERITIDLREAASLGGSGDGQGGKTYFDNSFAALRYANPFRKGARQIKVDGSSAQFVAKTGNATTQANPWGYTVTPNLGTPPTTTTIWQLPVRVVSAQLPIRTAAMSDINYINETLVSDLMQEISEQEARSMARNNDQSGSTTTTTGATDGLRGLKYYPGAAGATAAYGTSGTSMTNGLHTLATVGHVTASVDMESLFDMAAALPGQYWGLPGTAWHMSPSYISALKKYTHSANSSYAWVDGGDAGEGPGMNLTGWPIIPNPYLDATGTAGNMPVYLANWPSFLTIADLEEITIQAMDQTAPGFITLYAEARMASSVRDPFAGVRLIET